MHRFDTFIYVSSIFFFVLRARAGRKKKVGYLPLKHEHERKGQGFFFIFSSTFLSIVITVDVCMDYTCVCTEA